MDIILEEPSHGMEYTIFSLSGIISAMDNIFWAQKVSSKNSPVAFVPPPIPARLHLSQVCFDIHRSPKRGHTRYITSISCGSGGGRRRPPL